MEIEINAILRIYGLKGLNLKYATEEISELINEYKINSFRLPIGSKVTIIDDKENFGTNANKEKTITGYTDYEKKPIGYLLDGEGIFLNEDFKI